VLWLVAAAEPLLAAVAVADLMLLSRPCPAPLLDESAERISFRLEILSLSAAIVKSLLIVNEAGL
jgi:hypothetical protein